jgi:glycosyltransferase involved in cell wall biosynthesis
MSPDPTPAVAFFFDADAYVETRGKAASASGPAGLMGRQVAGKEFLDAYLTHGRGTTLTAVVRTPDRAEPLRQIVRSHPSGKDRSWDVRVVSEPEFLAAAVRSGPADRVLYVPCPPDARFAWARQATKARFALCGVTHTLSSVQAVRSLCELVAAPYEPVDALICTSRAVADMVRAVTGAYCDYLRDRFGGSPQLRPRLEIIPLGVNPDKFRPATPAERARERARLGAGDDEVLVLCVGRLSHHAKAHPFPVLFAADQAARRTGKKVYLVFAGWAAHAAIDKAYRESAARLAPAARVGFADGQDPAVRTGAWHAADVFVSLPDNVQETFGLVMVEGMASGLPVIGSDWDGYRDLVADGETGYLVPARMVRGATTETTTRLVFEQVNYDRFLAECSQAAVVDPAGAADALTRLVADPELRRRMGAAGRARAVEKFRWENVVRAYEALWAEQERAVCDWTPNSLSHAGPALYPAPEQSFASYPTAWLTDGETVQASPDAAERMRLFLDLALTNHVGDRRARDPKAVIDLLRSADRPRSVGELATELERAGTDAVASRATIAWLLKYDLLRTQGTSL